MLGTFLLLELLNGTKHVYFLQKFPPDLLQGKPATEHQNSGYMYSSAPAHYPILVCSHLDATYLELTWITCCLAYMLYWSLVLWIFSSGST